LKVQRLFSAKLKMIPQAYPEKFANTSLKPKYFFATNMTDSPNRVFALPTARNFSAVVMCKDCNFTDS
jgi:hypothetical protein